MKFPTPLRFLALVFFLILCVSFIAPTTFADTPIYVPVALAPLQRDTPVELVALTLDADISESNGRTIITGNSTYKLHNTERLTDLQAQVGFPTWAGDVYTFDPTRLNTFSVSIDGTRVRAFTSARADVKIGSAIRAVDWYTFTVPLEGDEKKTVRFDFQQDLGDSAMPRFIFGMLPATNWKGSIGSARLTLNFPNTTTLEQIIAYDPPNPEFDGQSITWRFTTKEPASNPTITFLRPSTWDDLNSKRRAAQQNPNDANARAALGNLLRQLAAIDSPRRDNLYAQAIAEMEAAVRLAPTNRTARQGLGALYEERAGPPNGPRNVAYLQLAVAQWEALQSDATARKQLAEDYFYLGLEAQTRLNYANAALYFDQAIALAPSGAGPLFTLERFNAQRRTLNMAWARQLIEQNDAAAATPKARAALGDKFMPQFTPPIFYVTRAQVTTSPHLRSMLFTLAPYSSPAELLNTASGTAAALRATDADTNLVADGSNLALSINIAFDNRSELAGKLNAVNRALPDRAEWALVRAVLAPTNLEWNETEEIFTHVTRYREDVDLSSACATFNARLDEIAKNLAPLAPASEKDDEAQLKRALLQYAQAGWQSTLATSHVTYHAGNAEGRVDACAAQPLAWSSTAWRIERVAILVIVIEVIGGGILALRWRKRKTRGQNSTTLA